MLKETKDLTITQKSPQLNLLQTNPLSPYAQKDQQTIRPKQQSLAPIRFNNNQRLLTEPDDQGSTNFLFQFDVEFELQKQKKQLKKSQNNIKSINNTILQASSTTKYNNHPNSNNSNPKALQYFSSSANKTQQNLFYSQNQDGKSAKYLHKVLQQQDNPLQIFLQKLVTNKTKRQEMIKQLHFEDPIQQKADHLFTILNIVEDQMSEKTEQNPQVFSLFNKIAGLNSQFQQILSLLNEQFSKHKTTVSELQQKLQSQEERESKLTIQKQSIANQLQQKTDQLRKLLEIDNLVKSNKTETRDNILALQNAQLLQQIDQLASKLYKAESGQDLDSLKEELSNVQKVADVKVKEYRDKYEEKESDLKKKISLLNSLQTQYQKLDFEFKDLYEKYTLNTKEYKKYKMLYDIQIDELSQWRERCLMTQEDFDTFQIKVKYERTTIQKLQEQNRALKYKVDKFLVQRSKEVDIPQNDMQDNEDRFMFQDKNRVKQIINTASEELNIDDEFADQLKLKVIENWKRFVQREEEQGTKPLDLSKLNYLRPTFYNFIESQFKSYELDYRNIGERKISLNFIGLLRAIQDAKYNEFLLESNYRRLSQFVDFLYSFLSKYTIDEETWTVRVLTQKEQITNEQKVNFILDLINPQFHSVWEVYIFREFLAEKSSIDEQIFYLHCRNLLLEGPYSERKEYMMDIVQYVRLEKAENLAEIILKNYDSQNFAYIKKQFSIRSKEKTRNGAKLIDAGFVLRVLAQFYIMEKQNRYKLFKEGFQSIQAIGKKGKFSINFENFQKLIEMSYHNVTALEVAQLYRDSISIGSGNLTVDSFFIAANENGFFVKYMRLPSKMNQSSQLEKNHFTKIYQNENYKNFYQIYEQNIDKFNYCFNKGKNLGVEEFTKEIEEYELLIKRKFSQDQSELLKGKPFSFFVQKIFSIVMQTSNISIFQKHFIDSFQNKFEISEILAKDMKFLTKPLGVLDKIKNFEQSQADLKNIKARQLQKAIMKKIGKFYSFISSLIKSKLRTVNIMEQN